MKSEIKNTIEKISTLIQKNELDLAEDLTKKFYNQYKDLDVPYNLMGIISQKKNKFDESVKYFKKAIRKNANFLSAHINLGIAFQILEKNNEAIKSFKNAIIINENLYEINNNIGKLYLRINNPKKAIKYINRSLELNPNYVDAFFALGKAYEQLKDIRKAINNYKESIKLKNDYHESYFELGEIYRNKKNFKMALKYFKNSNNLKTNIRILECYLGLNLKKKYELEIKKIIKISSTDRRIASASSYISQQFKIKDKYPFCPNPLDFIYKTNISNYFKNFNIFIESLLKEISVQSFVWEPSKKTTINGYSTLGNLSDKNLENISKLNEIIQKEMNNYYKSNKDKKVLFIKEWPKKIKINSWSNRLKREGYNIAHIHPSGWISGVFYLQMPFKIRNNEAGIEFSLHGDNFIKKNKNIPKVQIQPEIGDMILFPSSLFHKTIPFNSNTERVCIAFDIYRLN